MTGNKEQQTLISFRRYFELLEKNLGMLLVPIKKYATSPRTIVTSEALYHNLAREAALGIYRTNHCRTMNFPVRLFPTLDALGALRCQVEVSDTEDKPAIDFLEMMGEATLLILKDT